MTRPGPRLVLASASPRRVALLGQLHGVGDVVVTPADIDEDAMSARAGGGTALVTDIARAKAQAVWTPGTWVLAADTVVVHAGEILGKPRHRDHAGRMLRSMRDQAVDVLTSVVVVGPRGARADEVVRSTLHIGHPSDDAIAGYVASGAADDKAGGLAVQDQASEFVERLEGCRTNVYGLPLHAAIRLLDQAGLPAGGACPGCPESPHATHG